MLCIPKRECVPSSAHWNPKSAYLRTRGRINQFLSPAGLIAWWNNKTVRERVAALPEPGRVDLWARFEKRLAELNISGPPEYERNESMSHGSYR